MSLDVVELDGVAWEWVPFTLFLGRSLSGDEQAELRGVVDDWYADGSRGAFGGPMHSLDEVGFDDDGPAGSTAEWFVDMGDAEERALEDLAGRLDEWARLRNVSLSRLVLGTIHVS